MKTIKSIMMSVAVAAMAVCTTNVNAQNKKTEEVTIKTSAQCDMCKERIEKALAFEKGVKKANLDLTTKEVTVTYSPKKITVEQIKKAIAGAGYDADNVMADEKAYAKLPKCCQKGGEEQHK